MSDEDLPVDPLEDIALEFVRLHRSGTDVPVADFAARYPDHAERLRRLLPTIVCMERCSPTRANDSTVAGPRSGIDPLPRTLGDYRLLRVAGRGGMGVVYEAEQTALGRRVALKVLSQAATADSVRLIRFRREAQAAARLHHSNIVSVFGVGEENGQYFYAMQYIDGCTLRERLSLGPGVWEPGPGVARPGQDPALHSGEQENRPMRPATPSEESAVRFRFAAEVGRQAAEALAHAHEQGILHRDIKPGNLLIDRKQTVWVADFGLAKLEAGEDLTAAGDQVGTIRYMAPEQLHGQADGRSDLFALGLTVYEIMAGRPAFDGQQQGALVQQVTTASPPSLRLLTPSPPRDLVTIVEKLIDRDRAHRYQTARQAADDFQHFLRDEPISARRPGPLEKLARACQRNPATAALTATALLVPTLVAVGWALTLERANTRTVEHLQRAERAERERSESLLGAYIAQAQAGRMSRVAGQRWRAVEALDRAIPLAGELEMPLETKALLRDELIAAISLADLRASASSQEFPADGIDFPAFNATLSHYARCNFRGVISVRRIGDDRELAELSSPKRKSARLMMSPGGARLAAQAFDCLEVWDWALQHRLLQWTDPQGENFMTAFASDNQIAVRRLNGEVLSFDLDSGIESHRIETGFRQDVYDLCHFALSSDGTRIALSGWSQRRVQVHDTATGAELARFELLEKCADVAWSDDGRLLATTCQDFNTYIWNVSLGRQQAVLRGHRAVPHGPAFTANGDRLVTWSWDRTLRLWDPWNGLELARAPGLFSSPASDGRQIAAIVDRRIVVYRIEGDREFRVLPGAPSSSHGRWYNSSGRVSIDGRWLAVAGPGGVRIFDLMRGAQAATLPVGESFAVAFHDRGQGLFTRGTANVLFWPFQNRGQRWHVGPPRQVATADTAAPLTQAGSLLAIADSNRSIMRMLNLDDALSEPQEFLVRGTSNISLSSDGSLLVAGVLNGTGAAVYDVASGDQIHLLLPKVLSLAVCFSPDGRWLVTGSRQGEGTLVVWDTRTWKEQWRMSPPGLYDGFACSPDGSLLAVSKSPDRIELRRLTTGELVAGLAVPEGQAYIGLLFGRRGAALIGLATDPPYIALWDLSRIRAELAPRGLDWDHPSFPEPASDPDAAPIEIHIDPGESAG